MMKASLLIVENEKVKKIIFSSFKDARRFLEFILIFHNETGSKEYNAYLPYFYIWGNRFIPFLEPVTFLARPMPCFRKVSRKKNFLKRNFIRYMLFKIMKVRTCQNFPPVKEFQPVIRSSKDGIVFEMGELPCVKRPRKGDMYRVLRNMMGADVLGFEEGRVVKDLGDRLMVKSSQDDKMNKINPKILMIDANRVIRI